MADTLNLTDTQQVTFTIAAPKDRLGKPAAFDGVPAWQTSAEEVASLVVAADGMSALVVAGFPGDATISVSADLKGGPDTNTAGGAIDVHVTPGDPVSITLTAGTPEEQPGT